MALREGVDWRSGQPAHASLLTKPMRLELASAGAFREFLLALRTYHYRARSQGVSVYSDVFFDTEDWQLYRHGYSFRFRERKEGRRRAAYSVRLEREPRFTTPDAPKLDLTDVLPDALGERIARGAWTEAAFNPSGIETSRALGSVLGELGVAGSALGPRLRGELRRERFDIRDKGETWFELDHEVWVFTRFGAPSSGARLELEDLVLDTRLHGGDPQLTRRVSTMGDFVRMVHGLRPTDRAPHERAVSLLAAGSDAG